MKKEDKWRTERWKRERDYEIVTTLIRKFKDESGMGWTQYTVKIKNKKKSVRNLHHKI